MVGADRIHTVIFDSSKLFRTVLSESLSPFNIDVLGATGEEKELFDALARYKPGVLLLDLFSIEESFISFMKHVKEVSPVTRVMVLDLDCKLDILDLCLENGASGFCDKTILDIHTIANAIKKINDGGMVVLTKQTV